jgi:hypothetical protein
LVVRHGPGISLALAAHATGGLSRKRCNWILLGG